MLPQIIKLLLHSYYILFTIIYLLDRAQYLTAAATKPYHLIVFSLFSELDTLEQTEFSAFQNLAVIDSPRLFGFIG